MTNSNQYSIRNLVIEDIRNGSFFETLGSLRQVENLAAGKADEILADCQKSGIYIFVAIEDEKVIGTVRLLVEPKFYHNGSPVGHIEDVATHHNHFGRGIAAALITHAIEEAKKFGCYKIILQCSDELVPFYNKSGFEKSGNNMRLDI